VSFPYALRDYQLEAIAFARARSGSLLLHALGMGKTPMALGAADYPAAVVCPTSAVPVWQNEAEGCGLRTQVLRGYKSSSKQIARDVDLYIITYGSAHRWIGYFRRLGGGPELHTMIADEAQYMQRKTLRWSQAFRSVVRERTILLSATPLRNRLRSLWALLDAACPRAWGNQYEFRKRYCGAVPGDYGLVDTGATNVDELSARLSAVSLRKTWDEPDMAQYRPTLARKRLEVEVSAADRRRVFDEAARQVHDTFRGRDGSATTGQQIALLGRLRRNIGLLKAQWLCTRQSEGLGHPYYNTSPLEVMLSEGDRAVIWVWHKENAEYIYRKVRDLGIPVDKVTGDSPTKKRAAVLAEWERGDHHQPRVLVATIGALNAAVNLTTAKLAVFVEYDWAPLMTQQAECRHHRHGSRYDTVWAYYLKVPGTIDEQIADVLLEKAQEAEQVLGADSQTDQMRLLVDSFEDYDKSDDDVLAEAARRLIEGA
jgi:SNF2 family DNA or RNA helicase